MMRAVNSIFDDVISTLSEARDPALDQVRAFHTGESENFPEISRWGMNDLFNMGKILKVSDSMLFQRPRGIQTNDDL